MAIKRWMVTVCLWRELLAESRGKDESGRVGSMMNGDLKLQNGDEYKGEWRVLGEGNQRSGRLMQGGL